MGCVKAKEWGKLTCEGMLVLKAKHTTGVIGDLHIGYDSVFSPSISLPINYLDSVKEKLEELIEKYKLKKLVINGDIQHEFSPQVHKPLKDIILFVDFLNKLSQTIEIELIKGNHDTYIHKILEKHTPHLKLKLYTSIQDFYIFHGHVLPQNISLKTIKSQAKGTITSHQHPAVNIRDEVGGGMRINAFLVKGKHIILPSFQPFTYGTDILSVDNEELTNVVLKVLGKEEFEIYAISPFEELLYFGKVRELERVIRGR